MTTTLRIEGDGLERFDNTTRALTEGEILRVAARALNHTGARARTQVIRSLTEQTGLKRKTIVKALQVRRATAGNPAKAFFGHRMEFTIRSSGADVGLHHFDSYETDAGVSAAPFGKRVIFKDAFIYGGQWPTRASRPIAGGRAFYRSSGRRLPIFRAKSGVIIPNEMVKGATAAAFENTAKRLPARIAHEIGFSRDLQSFTKGARF